MKIAHEVLQTNGFWSHPENILISMLTDSCRSVSEKAVNCILTHRYSSINTIDTLFEPRKFIVPKINFGGDCYWNLVDIDATLITEPPLTTLVSDQDLQSAIEKAFNIPALSMSFSSCRTLGERSNSSEPKTLWPTESPSFHSEQSSL